MNCTQLQELAAAHALGALDGPAAVLLEAAIANEPGAKAEVAALNDTVAVMAAALSSPVPPPLETRAKILEQLTRRTQASPSQPHAPTPPGYQFIFKDAAGWRETPIPGLRTKLLSVSPDMGYRVLLAQIEPGRRFPAHDHASSEELYVISGHLQTEGQLLGPGDFYHAEPGTHHRELFSPDGCMALLIDRNPVAK